MHNLSELQQDALLEIFNVSIGRAASAMSDMVSETINMSVPAMQFLTRKEAGDILDLKGRRRICSVAQSFAGSFSGEALLMFPEENSLEIVRMMLGSTIPLAHLTELEQDALNEVGNIILNACMSAVADLLEIAFDGTLPVHSFGDTCNAFLDALGEESKDSMVLFLQVEMRISQHRIQGHIVFLLSVTSLEALLQCLDVYLVKSGLQ